MKSHWLFIFILLFFFIFLHVSGTKKMEYKTRQWHEKCFCCVVCKNPIGTKSFIPREQEIYCAGCYEDKFATRCVKCNKVSHSFQRIISRPFNSLRNKRSIEPRKGKNRNRYLNVYPTVTIKRLTRFDEAKLFCRSQILRHRSSAAAA